MKKVWDHSGAIYLGSLFTIVCVEFENVMRPPERETFRVWMAVRAVGF
jgi:hypothetical protein